MLTKQPKMFQKMQIYSPRFQCRFRNMLRLVKMEFGDRHDISVLDAGCGTGTLITVLEKLGYKPDGFDVHTKNVKTARSRTSGMMEVGDILTYRPKRKYDLVFCGEVLEHIKDDSRAIHNLRSMLKTGGLLVISVPNDPSLWNIHDKMGGHVRRYTKSELEEKLKSAGFDDFRSRYIGWPLVKRFMYGKGFRLEKEKFQKNPTLIKKLALSVLCIIERIDDIFNTKKADKIVLSCKAV